MPKVLLTLASVFILILLGCDRPLQKNPEPPQPPPANEAPASSAGFADAVRMMGGKSSGKMCGGIAAIQCGGGQFCHYAEGACRMPDASGTCNIKPDVCTQDYRPVCGCNGQTYSNACMAEAAGTSIASQGACAPQ